MPLTVGTFFCVYRDKKGLICGVYEVLLVYKAKERYPSGQRGQTVTLLAQPTKVRILPSPPLIFKFFASK